MSDDAPRPWLLREANHRQLMEARPRVAVLPWGATEAHNYHLPYATDVIEAEAFAARAAEIAASEGARVAVLPAVPFGANEQQLDQEATVSLSATTIAAILDDVARSLARQGIHALMVLNAHGGNEFKPFVRDVMGRHDVLVVVANFWQVEPAAAAGIFDEPGDHAGELETSLLLHLCPEVVELARAGAGARVPLGIEGVGQAGVWTPRPWSKCHPDTGCGDPRAATADKGARYFDVVSRAIARAILGLDAEMKRRGHATAPPARSE